MPRYDELQPGAIYSRVTGLDEVNNSGVPATHFMLEILPYREYISIIDDFFIRGPGNYLINHKHTFLTPNDLEIVLSELSKKNYRIYNIGNCGFWEARKKFADAIKLYLRQISIIYSEAEIDEWLPKHFTKE